jgi:hypothetical protein
MAIIVCDEIGEAPPIIPDATGSVTTEPTTIDDEVSLGKTLLAVESGFFLSDTLSPVISKVNANLLETRPPDVADTFRADSNRYWTLDENGNMKYMNGNIDGFEPNENSDSPPPTFTIKKNIEYEAPSTPLGLESVKVEYVIRTTADDIFNAPLWVAFIDGAEGEGGSSYIDTDGNSFTRPTSLIPTGQTFTDHAFTMNTPFSKKELEMFANISDSVKFDVADVESDYDFYFKAYEEGIAQSEVPENALPHLYTEVQRGESEAENTIIFGKTEDKSDQVEEGYFREWMNNVLSSQDEMHEIASAYENVAILDSTVDETNLLDSETKVISAFLLLMDYANRENLFPMNVNINVDTNENSNVMDEAESAGMVDDIVKMLIGDGDVFDADIIKINQVDKEIYAASYSPYQFTATLYSANAVSSISPEWTISTDAYGTIDSNGLFTPITEETSDKTNLPFYTIQVTARYESLETSTDLIIHVMWDGTEEEEEEEEENGDDESTSKGKGSEEDLKVKQSGYQGSDSSSSDSSRDVSPVDENKKNEELGMK